ncbi:4-hydroxythreonine-4-phosphate dehydrogenase PdxA [Altererythrobacter arenosus]|uniref:4-hydroxythreonine-4-phosphate dehydrogenase n=1 Tax=Altererythrobacter arenosus TaxID=3032592 RepID=A0ABY8FQV0_9SPHN|nr:4-hydroxythreonine-4-phosphate dehydrogenase PdxA [Altererythrobacter sp. CAU 1644]WFL76490.1 4-hydroxythreonine-4-phosphate dehydrogenase PdxA [Altererythrobacter sp. CAU 1644]
MTQPVAPLAVSIGDPAGIGPELIGDAWLQREAASLSPFFVVGGAQVLQQACAQRSLAVPLIEIAAAAEAATAFARGLPVLTDLDCEYHPGRPSEEGAALALNSLERASAHAKSGEASGLVTAPIAKSELAKVGFNYPGQTEYLAHVCDLAARDAVMMLASPSLRTVPLTVHCALADVPRLLSVDLICHKARIVHASLERDFGIERPRLAICGLNPHAGEDGKFGDEEHRIILPAIAALREEGIDATGPHPADALFTPRARANYHAAICMYHDQALIPLKALEFDEGVNVTLGLPIIRTSPDHGTAFDIAGTGLADPGAMIAAIRMAGECAARRAAHG